MAAQKQKSDKTFIIDFDSTLIEVEALDELAAISLKESPDGESAAAEIREITRQGMEGEISIAESLRRRLALLNANQSHLELLTKQLKRRISPSFKRNKAFLKRFADNIFVVTSGFREYVIPVVKELGLKAEHVYANSFTFDRQGKITGLDTSNVLSQERGKVEQLRRIKPRGDVYVIGDGLTDYQMKESGLVKEFIAFTENVARQIVIDSADRVAKSFDEVLYAERLPMKVSYPKSKIKVLLLEGIHPLAIQNLRAEGFSVETNTDALDEADLKKALKDVSILGIRSKTKVTEAALKDAKKLLAVGAFCIGTEQIDLNACCKRGIVAFNAPYSNTRSVVELALGEIIMLMRRIFESSTGLHAGKWQKSASGCFEIRGKKLGIVGYGNIGAQLSVIAESLGLEVYYHDVVEKLALGNAKKCRTLNELLSVADIVTLHVDGRQSNRNLFGEKEFQAMKTGAVFLNLSRGHIVDIEALVRNIKNGRVAGAAVDVFPKEPNSNKEEFLSELRGLPNVILTPHIGGSTLEAQRNIGEYVATRMIEYINSGSSFSSVNFPNIQLPSLQRAHRFLHIHNNVPGILAEINRILAKGKINILGQYLKTNEQIGYVITDVNKKYNDKIVEELKSVDHTIKFRVLY
jgi:D-3-phosphoglycerate dehydrogenase